MNFKFGDAMKLHTGIRFLKMWPMLLLAVASHVLAAAPGDQPISLATAGGGTVAGTLHLPAGEGKAPVVLIVAGSGPTDRDGNNPAFPGPNDSLKLLAE